MEKDVPIRTHPISGKYLVFLLLFLFIAAGVLFSANHGFSQNAPQVIDVKPADASISVSVYLSEVCFTIADSGDDEIQYLVTTSPDFIGGIQGGVAAPGKTIHILRRHELLTVETTYTWWVNVTDGLVWVNMTYSFFTEGNIFPGYTLFTPIDARNTSTFLIDQAGMVVHRWSTLYIPCYGVYLVENGSILRPYMKLAPEVGRGVQKITWNGTVVWDFPFRGENYWQTHDIAALPNGNVLILALERKNGSEALEAGRDSSLLSDGELWPVFIVEVHPTGLTSGEIVWEWHVWDHLIQDYDPGKQNYGAVSEHPELLDVNFALDGNEDWIHPNTLHYNPQLDQIIICSRHLGEFWIIDHSTTTEEAKNHTGGARDRGGDFLYRWGNPQTYRAGNASDQKLFGPHDAQWISPGCPGEGDILIFNNGWGRHGEAYSTIEEITPPMVADGSYHYTPGAAYGPENVTWQYIARDPFSFYASFISGCERLPNGNTLICNGPSGSLFEVTENGTTVWSYTNCFPAPGSLVFRVRRYYAFFSPPSPPSVTGPIITIVGGRCNFTLISMDPDQEPVYYSIDWGDTTMMRWIGPYHSGESITLTHSWVTEGTYQIRCQAKDRFDSLSSDSWWNISVGAPYQPSNPSPAAGAIDIAIQSNVSWSGGDPDPKDLVTYDVYFGNTNPPPKMVSNQTTTVYHPGVLWYNMRYYWRILSWDDHGMSTTSPLWNFTTEMDSTAPTTMIFLNGTLGNQRWFLSPVTITLESNDTQSGVNMTWYKIDADPWLLYTTSVRLLEEGCHLISFFSVDMMGNTEKIKSTSLKIDTKFPQVTHTFTGVLGNNTWYLSNVTITFLAVDNESGISTIIYCIDAGSWKNYSSPLVITSDGSHTLVYYSVDIAGNTQPLQGSFDFNIDQTMPAINLSVTAQNLLLTRWLFTATTSDETSGIRKVDFYIDDSFLGTRNAPGPYEWYYEGQGNVAYAIAVDNAGNMKTSTHVTWLDIHSQPRDRFGHLSRFLLIQK